MLVLRVWVTTQFYAVLGINTRTSCMQGKYSTNWATSTAANTNFWTHIMNFYPPMTYDLIWSYAIYCVHEARSMCMCGHQRSATGSQFSPATWLAQGSSHLWCCVVHSRLVVLWPSRQSSCLWHSSHYKGLRVQAHELLSSQSTFYKSLGIKFSYQPGQQVILLTEPSLHPYSAILDQIFFISKWIHL